MSEIITTYKLDGPDVAIPMDRDEFYKEQVKAFKQGKKPDRAVGIVAIFIFDQAGELFVQKRSDNKAHNAGLLDKTIGGHITFGNSIDYTVMVETVQELQVPSITLRTEEDFQKTYVLLHEYLNTIAIVKHIDTEMHLLKKNIKDQKIPIMHKVHLYFGVYNGAIKTVDREAKGVLLYSLEDLENEMKKFPMIYTEDLKHFIKKYRSQIVQFNKLVRTKPQAN